MGYSISVKFKNEEDKLRMKTFLIENHDLIRQLAYKASLSSPHHDNQIREKSELGYAPNVSNLLGFHGTGIPQHIWTLCAWMSVKSGVTNKNGEHYLYYDDEKMIVTFDTNNKKNTVVNQNGVVIFNKTEYSIFDIILGKKQYHLNQQKILNQLNDKWNLLLNSEETKTQTVKKNKIK